MRGGGRGAGTTARRFGAVTILSVAALAAGCRAPIHDEAFRPLVDHEDEATAVAEAATAHLAPGSCSTTEDQSGLPQGLGPFSQVCVDRLGGVAFGALPADDLTLAYGRPPTTPSECVRQVTERWWVAVQDDDRDVVTPCPSGFTFQGL